jgi:nickel/cobalt exporter
MGATENGRNDDRAEPGAFRAPSLPAVMAGLVPAIHAVAQVTRFAGLATVVPARHPAAWRGNRVDGRDKPGHDDRRVASPYACIHAQTPVLLRLWLASLALLASAAPSLAAAMNNRPFAVGGYEGGGAATGFTGWLLGMQSALTHLMSARIHALGSDPSAVWGLAGLGLAYGVFHAAGPGHGKAVIASYMMANDRALKRGAVLAFFAAMLQGAVAVALVGIAALLFNATARQMNAVADTLATLSYAGIAAIGAWLTWRKGRALAVALARFFERRRAIAGAALFAGAPWRPAAAAQPQGAFRVESPGLGVSGEDECGHSHAPDPMTLGDGFSWRGALATVVAAGARPCSGAILVLVFALSQQAFLYGVAATFAISLGTAVTTGALAFAAVFAKSLSMRFVAGEDTRVTLVARAFEFAAALAVLAFGLALWTGTSGGA